MAKKHDDYDAVWLDKTELAAINKDTHVAYKPNKAINSPFVYKPANSKTHDKKAKGKLLMQLLIGLGKGGN